MKKFYSKLGYCFLVIVLLFATQANAQQKPNKKDWKS